MSTDHRKESDEQDKPKIYNLKYRYAYAGDGNKEDVEDIPTAIGQICTSVLNRAGIQIPDFIKYNYTFRVALTRPDGNILEHAKEYVDEDETIPLSGDNKFLDQAFKIVARKALEEFNEQLTKKEEGILDIQIGIHKIKDDLGNHPPEDFYFNDIVISLTEIVARGE